MKTIFIIEHLEKKLWPWCVIEYTQSSRHVGKDNLWITNVNMAKDKIKNIGKIYNKPVRELNIAWDRACILDPEAELTLEPSDKDKFDYVIIGGILGEEKFNQRTGRELTKFLPGVEKRNIGKEQFTIDNAVYVAHKILQGISLDNIKFQSNAEIIINDVESVILPYCYPLVGNKPVMSDEIIIYLKNKKGF